MGFAALHLTTKASPVRAPVSRALYETIMIYGQRDSSQYLYHYTRTSIAIKYILPSNNLKLGNYSSTNDPKESKQWEFSIGTNEQRDLSEYDMNKLSKKLSNSLKAQTKILCFSKDGNDLTGDHLTDIYKRGFCKPRMWAQYGDNHSGLCLVFDWKKLQDCIEESFKDKYWIIHRAVNYINRSIVPSFDDGDYSINIDYLEKYGFGQYTSVHFKQYHQRLFFEKLADWRQENEYRWVIATNTLEPIYVDYKSALIGVVFGENTREKDIDKVISLTNNDISYTGLKWKNCSPWYDLSNMKYIKNAPVQTKKRWFRL